MCIRDRSFKASEIDAVSRIVVAPDGQSFVVVEDDERHARQLAWDGKVLLGPYRANHAEMISGAFFHEGSPWLILRDVGSMADVTYAVVKLGPPNERQVKSLDPRR